MGFGEWEVRDLMICTFVFDDSVWIVRDWSVRCMTCAFDGV
jgi:hypothetical protein